VISADLLAKTGQNLPASGKAKLKRT